MLKDFLNQFDQICITDRIDNSKNDTIITQQLVGDNFERIFNNEYVSITFGKDLFSPINVMLKNNPDNMEANSINEYEYNIVLSYGDVVINMIGYKNKKF